MKTTVPIEAQLSQSSQLYRDQLQEIINKSFSKVSGCFISVLTSNAIEYCLKMLFLN